MRALSDLGMESREARVRLQLPPAEHAAGVRVSEAAGALPAPPRRAHCEAAAVREPAVGDDGRRAAGGADTRGRREECRRHGVGGSGRRYRGDRLMAETYI